MVSRKNNVHKTQSTSKDTDTSETPSPPFVRILKFLGNGIFIAVVLLFLVIALSLITGKYRAVSILSGSMAPEMPKNSLAIATEKNVADLKVGDVMIFQEPTSGKQIIAHRIIEISDGKKPLFKTKGDANSSPDKWNFFITGNRAWIVVESIPKAGSLFTFFSVGSRREITIVIELAVMIFAGILVARGQNKAKASRLKQVVFKKRQSILTKSLSSRATVASAFFLAVAVLVLYSGAYAAFTASSTTSTSNPVVAASNVQNVSYIGCSWTTSLSTLSFNWSLAGSGSQNNTQLQRGTVTGGPYGTQTNFANPATIGTDAPSPVANEWFYAIRSTRTGTSWTSSNTSEIRSDRCQFSIDAYAGTGTVGATGDTGAATSATLNLPRGISTDSSGNLYIADFTNNRIRKVTKSTGIITTIAGGGATAGCTFAGAATAAILSGPSDVTVDSAGDIYIAESTGNCIRKITVATGQIARYVGNGTAGSNGDGGLASAARVSAPLGLAVNGTHLYIADSSNNRIRRVLLSSGVISLIAGTGATTACTFAGAGTGVSMSGPRGISFDAAGDLLIADTGRSCIRKLAVATGQISQVMGGGTNVAPNNTCAFSGLATAINLSNPSDVIATSTGSIYVTQLGRRCIVKQTGTAVANFAGTGVSGNTGDNGPSLGALLASPWGLAYDSASSILLFSQNLTTPSSRVRAIYSAL
ncbi:MAG TPA: signal peptidase I [Acidimicrobiia bacterium]|nr:signal peptidase I [Acidimicrobiia bacterium]